MLKKRVIATIMIKDGLVVQSIGFQRYLPIGRMDIVIEYLEKWDVDEIAIIDIGATSNSTTVDYNYIKMASTKCFLPISAGGGVNSIVGYTDLLSDALISQPLENAIRRIFNLDYVKIKSGFLSSYIITKFSFDETVDSVHNSDENISALLNNNTISMGKFITDDFFVKGSIGTTYDNNQIGVDVGLSLTLNTPHFQLGFDLAPKMDENIFSPEFGLSLEWKYSPIYNKGE